MSTPAPQSPLDRTPPKRERRGASWLAGALATLAHGALLLGAAAVPAGAPRDLPDPDVTELFEVELEPEPPPAAPEPEPQEPEPAPEEPPPPPPRAVRARPVRVAPPPEPPPVEEPPPAEPADEAPPPEAAAAAEVLTAEPEAEPVVDFGTIVSGNAAAHAGGVTQAGGTSATAVRDGRARAHGVPGGTGEGTPDLSRPAGLAGGRVWKCPFPREADYSGVDSASVTLGVDFGPGGSVRGITVKDDPGHGFGREALRCARRQRWQPALDRQGQPRTGVLPVRVGFRR